MEKDELVQLCRDQGRIVETAVTGDEALGPLNQLPGVWANEPGLIGRGWNMIALPFADGKFGYRVLVNQYNESLKFSTVDKGVPNRGIPDDLDGDDGDQLLAVIEYEQSITQIASDDFPASGKAGNSGLAIHHEPGLLMHIINKRTNNIDIARLATIPHGDSVLALGNSFDSTEPPIIPPISSLPIGVDQSLENDYLEPYKHYDDNPFLGLFNPVTPNELLAEANKHVNIVKTTRLDFDTKIETGGIVNIPFITKQANATEMTATFWIQELAEKDEDGKPKLRLQYSQTVFLDFFPRRDGVPGSIRWPHVSINTLEKISDNSTA